MKKLILASVGFLLLNGPLCDAQAAFIALETNPAVSCSNGTWRVHMKLVNRGSEAAHAITVEATVDGIQVTGPVRDRLDPWRGHRTTLTLPRMNLPPGRHTVVLRTRYTDSDGYPFSALDSIALQNVDTGTRLGAIKASLDGGQVWRHGTVALRVTPVDPTIRRVTARLVLPDELACSHPVRRLELHPGRTTVERYQVLNRTSRPHSRYAVITVLDIEREGLHESGVVQTCIDTVPFGTMPTFALPLAMFFFILLAAGFVVLQQWPAHAREGSTAQWWTDGIVLSTITAYILWHFPLPDMLSNSLAVGGDTPAHHYLAAHLREQIVKHGRVVSWAPGWWCGFPMFQYYFCLPYILMVVLSLLVPLAAALKLVSLLSVLAVPLAAWFCARAFRTPHPIPSLAATAMLPLLFDGSHTMWGVNLQSMLSGMIANSLSFACLLFFLGAAARDTESGHFRLRTALWFTLVLASHFFTSVIAVIAAASLPLTAARGRRCRVATVLCAEGLLGASLMAWWLLPLIAKRPYSVDFGLNWDVQVWTHMPTTVRWSLLLIPFSLAAAREPCRRWVNVLAWIVLSAAVLFQWGFSLSPVFVNIRLWPFMLYGLLTLAAVGGGMILRRLPAPGVGTVLTLLAVILFATPGSRAVRNWTDWNYTGLQAKPHSEVITDLVLPLDGTPGRLANDLHDGNRTLGSSRVFEMVPALIDKPILEGGIVNSALGSLFAYYIQGETSRACAGFPPIVKPTSFNFANATRHLELCNVKHFIARWEKTQAALAASDDWTFVDASHDWQLYELTTHDGGYVFVPPHDPAGVIVTNWQQAALAWIYTPQNLDRPLALLHRRGEAGRFPGTVVSEADFHAQLAAARQRGEPTPSAHGTLQPVSGEYVENDRIRFHTTAIGRPHIIKSSYFPNWKVRGAEAVYMVTPGFMLVYPTAPDVELYYGTTMSDSVGRLLTAVGAAITLGIALVRRQPGTRDGHTNSNSQAS
jgi:hypothetical protein